MAYQIYNAVVNPSLCIKDTGTQKQDTQNELAQVGEFESIVKYGAYRIFHPISSYVNNVIAHSFDF